MVKYPGKSVVKSTIHDRSLYVPTYEDICKFIYTDNLSKYKLVLTERDKERVFSYLSKLDAYQRCFLFYSCNLHNFIKFNKEVVRELLIKLNGIKDKCLEDIKNDIHTDEDVSIFSYHDEDMTNFISIFGLSLLNDTQMKEIDNKAIIQAFIKLCKDSDDTIYEVFKDLHKEMLRIPSLMSDTDSIIYTLQFLIEETTGTRVVNETTLGVSSFFNYLTFKHLEHIFHMYSIRLNICKKNYKKIQIKNEFTYPAYVRGDSKKTYIGTMAIQEGAYFKDPHLDIKGLKYKSSSLPIQIVNDFNDWVKELLTSIADGNDIDIRKSYTHIHNIEKHIIQSLKDGDTSNLWSIAIKEENQYKTPYSSNYFNYVMYRDILEPEYIKRGVSRVELPTKFYKWSLKKGIKKSNVRELLHPIKNSNSELYDRFVKFFNDHPKKEKDAIYLPQTCDTMLDELMYLVDYTSIVANLLKPYYSILTSLGYGIPSTSDHPMILDNYML